MRVSESLFVHSLLHSSTFFFVVSWFLFLQPSASARSSVFFTPPLTLSFLHNSNFNIPEKTTSFFLLSNSPPLPPVYPIPSDDPSFSLLSLVHNYQSALKMASTTTAESTDDFVIYGPDCTVYNDSPGKAHVLIVGAGIAGNYLSLKQQRQKTPTICRQQQLTTAILSCRTNPEDTPSP